MLHFSGETMIKNHPARKLPLISATILLVSSYTCSAAYCYNEKYGVEDRNCLSKTIDRSDSQLARLYARIHKRLKENVEERKKSLRNKAAAKKHSEDEAETLKYHKERLRLFLRTHAAWKRYRKSLCKAAHQHFDGGTMAASGYARCHIDETRRRIGQLKKMY